MLKKFEERINVNLPFRFSTFLLHLSCSTIIILISLLIVFKLPKIGFTGLLFLVVVFFWPSFVAYDVCSAYQDSHNVPKLLHPKRLFILLLNLLLGVTGIGWLVALALSISPGSVEVDTVKYVKITTPDSLN